MEGYPIHMPASLLRIKRLRRIIATILLFSGFSLLVLVFFSVAVERFYPFTIETPSTLTGCVFPRLNPFDATIQRFISHPRTLKCTSVLPEIVSLDDEGFLFFHGQGTKEVQMGKMQCYFREISGGLEPNRTALIYGLWAPVKPEPQHILLDQFEVRCYERNKTATGAYVVPPKNPTTAYADLVEIYRNAFLQVAPRTQEFTPAQGLEKLSIDILVLESISWNQFRRHFPMSFRFMEGTMKFTFFEKHGKADDNTLVNLIPLLTGKRFTEYSEVDKVKMDFDILPLDSNRDIPFLWKNFSKEGCVTFFNDDPCHPSRGFSFYPRRLLHGFNSPPTDYYYRAGHLYHRLMSHAKQNFAAKQSKHCRGNVPYHQLMLDMTRQFMEKYSGTCRFSVSSSLHETLHDFATHGEMIDNDLLQFLERLHRGRALENSMFIVMGDHGHRMQSIKFTRVGQFEERTSMVAILMPQKFQDAYPKLMRTLKFNTQQLTNHFDIYETMRDVFENRLEELERRGGKVKVDRLHGRTLFQPIPFDRDCADAGILPQFCVCLERSENLHPVLNMTSPAFKPLALWLKRKGYAAPAKALLVDGGVFSANQLVRRSMRHLSDPGRNLTETEEIIDFLDFVADLESGKQVHAQIQRTRQLGKNEVYAINYPPEVFNSI